jgi:hypothetical protein
MLPNLSHEGTLRKNFLYTEEPLLIKIFTGQQNVIARSAMQFLPNYCQENLFVKDLHTNKNQLTFFFSFLCYQIFVLKYQTIISK